MARHAVVTGAAGLLGRHIATAFRDAGYRVTALDREVGSPDILGADLTELDTAIASIPAADVIVHAAAIPRPVGYQEPVVFGTNMALMYNVLAAAEKARIPKLLYASSFSTLGLPFAPMPVEVLHFPVGEEHPTAPQDVYAVTKLLGEEMVDAWHRRTGRPAASIRMPWIQTPESFTRDVVPRRDTPDAKLDLWAYVDGRDAADAFLAAAEASFTGHERYFISAADTYSTVETDTLLRQFYPDAERRSALPGHAALLSNDKAHALTGYTPRHSWRDYS